MKYAYRKGSSTLQIIDSCPPLKSKRALAERQSHVQMRAPMFTETVKNSQNYPHRIFS